MLKNSLYCGIIRVWDLEQKGNFEPLISEQLFNQCQRTGRKHKSFNVIAKNPNFPLRKLVACAHCKESVTGSHSTGRHGKKYPYYHHHKHGCMHALSIAKDALEDQFVEYLKKISPDFQYEHAFKEIVLDIWKNNTGKALEQNTLITKEIEKLNQKKSRIYDLLEEGVYSQEEFYRQRLEVTKLITEKESLIVSMDAQTIDMEKVLDDCFNKIRHSDITWLEYADDHEKRLRFQNLIFKGNILYTKNNGFGTAILSPIYSIYQHWLADKSSLVRIF